MEIFLTYGIISLSHNRSIINQQVNIMVKDKEIDINNLINTSACFDLQFRQDIKHNRPNSPTYYRWKVQFVVTNKLDILEKVKNIFGCGKIHLIKNQARFSVQNIGELKGAIIPYFNTHPLINKKKKDFNLWAEAVEIICKNKGKTLSSWGKGDFQKLLDLQKSSVKFKSKPKNSKWVDMAQDLAKSL